MLPGTFHHSGNAGYVIVFVLTLYIERAIEYSSTMSEHS